MEEKLTEKAITGIEILKKIEKISDLRSRLEYYFVWTSEIMTAFDDKETEGQFVDFVQSSDILKRANELLLKELELSDCEYGEYVDFKMDLILTAEEDKVISELVKEKVFYNCQLKLNLNAL